MARRALAAALLLIGAGTTAKAELQGTFFVPQLQVNPISATEIEVLQGPSEGARTYWCAAAFYTHFTLGRSEGRLYLSRALGPARTASGTRGVSFSLTETPTTINAVSLSIRHEGATLLINHALQFCRDSDLEADQ
ncbi:MAG: hypothetical protein HKN30_18290 [Sulfitobacter sp.]|nr:hypothetical protein [Sulfitobacter sp.]